MKTCICALVGSAALAAACSSQSKPPTDATQYAQTAAPESPPPSTKANPSPSTGPSRALRESQFGQLPATASNSSYTEPSEADANAATIRTNRDVPDTIPSPSDRSPAVSQQPAQDNGQSDLQITQQIQKAVLGHPSLSFGAKNVNIMTANGQVTLRGVVQSDDERRIVADEARRIAGNDRVDDQIEVKNE